jgi:hypothetical protein
VGLTAFDRGDARCGDRLRRIEVGLADLEVDDVTALGLERACAREDLERGFRYRAAPSGVRVVASPESYACAPPGILPSTQVQPLGPTTAE